MHHELIIAGSGGQGTMLMGQLLAYSGMLENKHVTWIPSYGPEMRGGTANCSVIVSDEPIGSPIVNEPTVLVSMNRPSLDKFATGICPAGLLLINASLVDIVPARKDITMYQIKANDIAADLGNPRVANIVMLGALIKATDIVSQDSVIQSLHKLFASKQHLIGLNERALQAGFAALSR